MTTFDVKVLGHSATPSRASWWFSARRFSTFSQKSPRSSGQGTQPTGIITVSPVSKEPAPLEIAQPTSTIGAVALAIDRPHHQHRSSSAGPDLLQSGSPVVLHGFNALDGAERPAEPDGRLHVPAAELGLHAI